MNQLISTIQQYKQLGIENQIDYNKFYLYSIITHSTAIEGSTVTEIENQLLFDEGITVPGHTLQEQMMNLDLKAAYEAAKEYANNHADYSVKLLCSLSAIVMKNTGASYNTPLGSFSAANGELRLVNVTAGFGGRSYLAFQKVPQALQDFCLWLNNKRKQLNKGNIIDAYRLSFLAHYRLVTIHPWVDGNGRMARLVMNMLQMEYGLIPSKILKEQKAEYIQALVDTRQTEDEQIFCNTMFNLHNNNLKAEISAYIDSVEDKNVPKDVPKELTHRQQVIMDLIRENAYVTIQEMSQKIQVSDRSIKRDLQLLQQLGIIHRQGTRKLGYWEIIQRDNYKL